MAMDERLDQMLANLEGQEPSLLTLARHLLPCGPDDRLNVMILCPSMSKHLNFFYVLVNFFACWIELISMPIFLVFHVSFQASKHRKMQTR